MYLCMHACCVVDKLTPKQNNLIENIHLSLYPNFIKKIISLIPFNLFRQCFLLSLKRGRSQNDEGLLMYVVSISF